MNKLVDRIVNSTDTFKELIAFYILVLLAGALVFSFAEEKSFGRRLFPIGM